MAEQYQLVITGVQPEWTLEKAALALASMTKTSSAKTTELIKRAPTKFGKPLNQQKAATYKEYLIKSGLEVSVIRLGSETSSNSIETNSVPVRAVAMVTAPSMSTPLEGLSLVPTGKEENPIVDERLLCPNCQSERQRNATECNSCGIVYAKYQEASAKEIDYAVEEDEYAFELEPEEVTKMLKNTYMLLGGTLAFSAITCFASMAVGFSGGFWMYIIGAIVLLVLTHLTKNSALGLVFVFAFTGWIGFFTGPIIDAYLSLSNGAQLIGTAALGTATIFFGLSAYVLTTKKDLSFMGGFLFSGLIVVVVGGLAAFFFELSGLSLAISCISILVFSGYILYDTSQIIHRGETNYIIATVELYLDIINLFLSLLRILSYFSGEE